MKCKILHLEETVHNSYSIITDSIVICKSAFMGVCAEINRLFRTTLHLIIGNKLTQAQFSSILSYYPSFSSFDLNQFSQLMRIFLSIRNDNAHLYASDPIFIDETMVPLLSSIVKPFYSISKDGELTLYGAFHIVALLANKLSIEAFIGALLTQKICDIHVQSGKEMDALHRFISKAYTSKARSYKPDYSYPDGMNKCALDRMNLLLQNHLSKIFFSFEQDSVSNDQAKTKYKPFKKTAKKASKIFNSQEDKDKLISLRNMWCHGVCLYDNYKKDKKTKSFTLDEVFEALFILQDACLRQKGQYIHVLNAIDDFAKSILDSYCQRLVKITYKIIDRRLKQKEKFPHRILKSWTAYQNLQNTIPGTLENVVKLYHPEDMKWVINAFSFKDYRTRRTVCKILRIFVFDGNQNIKIGHFKTRHKNFCLADVDLPTEYQLKINGYYLKDLQGELIKDISGRIQIYRVAFKKQKHPLSIFISKIMAFVRSIFRHQPSQAPAENKPKQK